jgi:hypothetical protein
MSREVHVQFCERAGVKLPCATHHADSFPLETTEHNPHPDLLESIETYQTGLVRVFYCPEARYMETYAQDPKYTPMGGVDSVVDTPANRAAGNISYVYFSFRTNKYCAASPGGCWQGLHQSDGSLFQGQRAQLWCRRIPGR